MVSFCFSLSFSLSPDMCRSLKSLHMQSKSPSSSKNFKLKFMLVNSCKSVSYELLHHLLPRLSFIACIDYNDRRMWLLQECNITMITVCDVMCCLSCRVNPKKKWSIQPKLQSMCAADVQLKEFAQRVCVNIDLWTLQMLSTSSCECWRCYEHSIIIVKIIIIHRWM